MQTETMPQSWAEDDFKKTKEKKRMCYTDVSQQKINGCIKMERIFKILKTSYEDIQREYYKGINITERNEAALNLTRHKDCG